MVSRRVLAHAGLALGALVMLYPVLWMLASSFKTQAEIFTSASLVPVAPTAANYVGGWTGPGLPFWVYLLNSLLVCSGVVIGNILSCSLAAYAFARMRFLGRGPFFALMLATIMLPHHVTLVAQYAIFRDLGWIDTFLPLVVPKFLATDAFFVFLMVQFIRGLPRELYEAARIDGCGPFQIYLRIVMPLLKPALVTTAIFSFIWTYNDFFSQLIYLSSPQNLTVPLALRSFLDASGQSEWGEMFAMSIVTLVPVVAVFVVFQRRIVAGMAHTGLK
ncbi:carbohydrate ABC transporter permease [Pseudonocardia zijingensis]|jgi:multiple sugar transport system permease protein|uniref:Carbohydrate ABC transporter permease n=1 Tax=Pseudonocardia zijingensis TaxID=153376 RepID=A0ABP3YSK6_9PSEU